MYISNNPYTNENLSPHIIAAFKIEDEKICLIPYFYRSKYPLIVSDQETRNILLIFFTDREK